MTMMQQLDLKVSSKWLTTQPHRTALFQETIRKMFHFPLIKWHQKERKRKRKMF